MKQRGSATMWRADDSRLRIPVRLGSTFLIVALVLMQLALPAWGSIPGGTPSARAAQESDTGDEGLPTAGPVIVVLNPQVGFRAQSVAETADVAPSAVYSSAFSGFAADLDETQIQDLAANPDVAYIMPDLPVYAAAQTPSTGIKRSGVDKYPPAAIDGVDNPTDVDIAILDSGIDSGHPDLNVAGGVNCLGGTPSSSGWGDENGHGTHVAGIAGARDNSIGSVGSAPGARVWAVRVLDQNGNGSYSSVLCGLDWVTANAGTIDVVNMSLTANNPNPSTCTTGGDALHTAVCTVSNAGIPVVVAAGNARNSALNTVPAKYDEAISVAAVTDYNGLPGGGAPRPGDCPETALGNGPDDSLAGYSNYGGLAKIAAPGTCILSTWPGGGYALDTGTSMASPLVAGAVGLYLAGGGGDPWGWLFGSATVAQGSSLGYSGSSGGPMLILADPGSPTPTPSPTTTPTTGPTPTMAPGTNPPGTANPTFSGSQLTITGSTSSPADGTVSSTRVHDGYTGTSWYTIGSTPTTASFTLDLGSVQQVSGVKWMFRLPDGADQWTLEISSDGSSWTSIGTFGNAPVQNSWYGTTVRQNARYVRATFTNTKNRPVLGYMSEMQVWGGAAATPTVTPTVTPTLTATATATSTATPTMTPTVTSTIAPTNTPTTTPTMTPTAIPATATPTNTPTVVPPTATATPTNTPTVIPPTATATTVPPTLTPTTVPPTATSVPGTYPPGTANPSFGGSQLPIVSSTSSPANSTISSTRVHDGYAGTSWYTIGGTPTTASFTLDLGAVQQVSGIKWMFRLPDGADQWTLEISSDGSSWTSIGTFGNAPAQNSWYGATVGQNARYVRATFLNPLNRAAIGYMSEMQVWGTASTAPTATPTNTPTATPTMTPTNTPTATPTKTPSAGPSPTATTVPGTNPPGTANPSFSGSQLAITGSTSSPAGSTISSTRVHDGYTGTSWYTLGGTPTTASFTLDLGAVQQVSGIKWMFRLPDGADQWTLEVSANGSSWTTIGTFGNAPVQNSWYGTTVGQNARYVRATFANPLNRPTIGYMSEMQVWGVAAVGPTATPTKTPTATPTATPTKTPVVAPTNTPAVAPTATTAPSTNPPGTANPSFTGSQLTITGSTSEPAGSTISSTRVHDGYAGTSWYTIGGTPTTASFTLDLGSVQPVSGIKWMFRLPDGADQWTLEVSTNGSSWTSIGTFGNAPAQNSWYGATVGQDARYVRATFTNTMNRPVLGYMSEMQVWGSAALAGASAEKTVVTPTAIPTEAATATSAPTETPPATATPSPTTEPTATPTTEPPVAPTLEPTAEPTATVMPTATAAISAAGETATVVGTDGEGVFCRVAPSTDAEVITTLPEGSVVEIAGPAADGWTPVTCGADTVGYVSTDFLASGGAASTATVTAVEMATPEETIVGIEPIATEVATSTATVETAGSTDTGEVTEVALEPTLEPTVEPTAEPSVTPLPIVATSDSEQTGTAYMAVDDDPATSWTVVPNLSPKRVELLLDLGQVQPVGRATVELSTWNTLPYTEIWLSEDGETWWNVTQVDGSSLEPDQTYEFPLGYWARYVLVVVPYADESGLAEIGGIRQLSIWESEDGNALTLDMLGMPVTPEPLPTEPPPPTDVPVATEPPLEEEPVETLVPEATVAPEVTEPEGEDIPADSDAEG